MVEDDRRKLEDVLDASEIWYRTERNGGGWKIEVRPSKSHSSQDSDHVIEFDFDSMGELHKISVRET